MKWRSFRKDGKEFKLNHLNPFKLEITQKANNGKGEKKYLCWITFSSHCFTREARDESIDPSDVYQEPKSEERLFCTTRYRLSLDLRKIIESKLSNGDEKCFHTGHGNFFIVESVDENGNKYNYEIYFRPRKVTGKECPVSIYIESAYPRTIASEYAPKKRKKIKIQVLVFNTLMGKPLKLPPS